MPYPKKQIYTVKLTEKMMDKIHLGLLNNEQIYITGLGTISKHYHKGRTVKTRYGTQVQKPSMHLFLKAVDNLQINY